LYVKRVCNKKLEYVNKISHIYRNAYNGFIYIFGIITFFLN